MKIRYINDLIIAIIMFYQKTLSKVLYKKGYVAYILLLVQIMGFWLSKNTPSLKRHC